MAHDDPLPKAESERARALKRLNEVVAERSHLRELQTTAKRTSGEVGAAVLLRAADEQVVARQRWLKLVDEQEDLMQ